ncbi:hypothetical protein HYT57_02670 [Candidatus Woesearchaeota archaeon]|nr:hypothetical protein [Candidatus Woesearchaeota archaeon]
MICKIPFKKFIGEISNAEFIIIGELHGTKEIPIAIRTIIKHLKIDRLYFEIPDIYQSDIKRFFEKNKDGRGSKEYFNLIRYFSRSIKLKFIESTKVINKDKGMFKNVINSLRGKGLVVCGNMHGSYNNILFFQKTFGHYMKQALKDKVVNINIIPISGGYYNFGIRKVIEKKISLGVYKNFEKGYDYTYFIDKSTPCSFIS